MNKRLDKLFKNSKKMSINNQSKIVIMSDCHRGIGDINDNFKKNKNIYGDALNYYYKNGFTYIELGDGDEMWEIEDYDNIIKENIEVFKIIKKFHDKNRLIMLYGNHDIIKRNQEILEKHFYKYNNVNKEEDLLNNLTTYETLILNYDNKDIFLIHGHQLDIINSSFWKLTRFLIKNAWKKVEKIGIKDITNNIKNNKVENKIERKLKKWSIKNNKIIITGHTHNPIYPEIGDSLYFNDGSCIHPDGITCIEIENGNISLVKWTFAIKDNKIISVEREIIIGNKSIDSFYNNIQKTHTLI